MILQALVAYYDRSQDMAPAGWERKRIPYVIEIDADGRFVQLSSLRTGTRATEVATSLVPKSETRSGVNAHEKPNLLWDHLGFVLGHAKADLPKEQEQARKQFHHFRQRVDELVEAIPDCPGLLALQKFYLRKEHERVRLDSQWKDAAGIAGCNVTFRQAETGQLLAHDARIRAHVDRVSSASAPEADGGDLSGTCLVTGERDHIERLHAAIGGISAKPAPLAAINDGSLPAFASYGKHQGENFPVGRTAAFKYTTALNHLLRPDSRQRLRLGEASCIFWGQEPDDLETGLAAILGLEDDPDAHTQQVSALMNAVHSGGFDGARGKNRFHVLGLAPNSARIVVRFWHSASLAEIATRVREWFDDTALSGGPFDKPYPALRMLLRAVVLQRKDDNVPPTLAGDVLRAIFEGTALPALWLNLAVQRCRAEREVPYLRAAVIKACINRSLRLSNSHEEVYTAMLDTTNTQPAYRLGRLFAVLEKIQEESAGGGLNKTIRDRFYGAASSTPASVVPMLLKLKNHHLGKLDDRGQRMLYRAFQDHRPDDYIGAVLDGVGDIPAHLSLPEQGRFALGYYHQRQAFFSKAAPIQTSDTTPLQGN
ncbi:MAG: type I-C CRISPR-associated protein Cas8c/Csd1 [Rubrivivax sp.]|nr:type I-C CRISPR-associated protein Cas8c/Csd1 [Rubrivivax sp.]